MSYNLREVGTITCDECEEEVEGSFNKDGNPTMEEHEWFESLKDEGWIYDGEKDEHYCPKCAKGVRYEKAYNILMDYFMRVDEDMKQEIDKKLKKIGL